MKHKCFRIQWATWRRLLALNPKLYADETMDAYIRRLCVNLKVVKYGDVE